MGSRLSVRFGAGQAWGGDDDRKAAELGGSRTYSRARHARSRPLPTPASSFPRSGIAKRVGPRVRAGRRAAFAEPRPARASRAVLLGDQTVVTSREHRQKLRPPRAAHADRTG